MKVDVTAVKADDAGAAGGVEDEAKAEAMGKAHAGGGGDFARPGAKAEKADVGAENGVGALAAVPAGGRGEGAGGGEGRGSETGGGANAEAAVGAVGAAAERAGRAIVVGCVETEAGSE